LKKRQLPPLNPLRSFEAAARNASFTLAAEELHVTTVAISRQVAVLEDYYGIALFERLHQSIRLTAAGRDFLPNVTTALDLLDESSRRLRGAALNPLVVCGYPSFIVRWLIPRLPRFRAQHPDIEITISTAVKPKEFDYDVVDIGVQFVNEVNRSISSTVILPDLIQPVCTPSLASGSMPLPPAENLQEHTFLHSRYRRLDWGEWLDVAGLRGIKPVNDLVLKGSDLAYQAAGEGLGVVVAQRILAEPEIESGRLLAPFSLAAQRPHGLCLVHARRRLEDSRVRAFHDWITEEAERTITALGTIKALSPGVVCPVELWS
jgi:LysR family glycine cleavage system transcriptional activator